jgi:hypothetical protein
MYAAYKLPRGGNGVNAMGWVVSAMDGLTGVASRSILRGACDDDLV